MRGLKVYVSAWGILPYLDSLKPFVKGGLWMAFTGDMGNSLAYRDKHCYEKLVANPTTS